MNPEEGMVIAKRLFQNVCFVASYMDDLHPKLLEKVNGSKSDRDKRLVSLYQRSLAWMLTLAKLNKVTYFQAIVAGTRALLETTVDIVLMYHDKGPQSASKMEWWEESEKLKAAEALMKYFEKSKKPVPDPYRPIEDFVKNRGAQIDQQRLILWPNPKNNKPRHPKRWTGDWDLLTDVREVDKLQGAAIKDELGTTLEEFYEATFRSMCWNTHGSGLGGIRGLDTTGFLSLCATALKWSSDLAMFSTKIVLADFGLTNQLQEWNSAKAYRMQICLGQVQIPSDPA
jgi:hypothetical protein